MPALACKQWDVAPFIANVTGAVNTTVGATNTISYRGLYNGSDFKPIPAEHPDGSGFDAMIFMRSYLVFYVPRPLPPPPQSHPSQARPEAAR